MPIISKPVEGGLPDREGKHGRAWRCRLSADVDPHTTIVAWVVEAAWAHPLWANYAILVAHLRSAPGVSEAKILLPGATHEVSVYALDPERSPDLSLPFSTALMPANFHGQWIAASDIDAEAKIEKVVEEIVAGVLSPDTDFRREWVARFSDSNTKDGPAEATR